jgi:two-component system LytT family response regulator
MDINALIVDDEAPARDELAYLVTGHPDVETSQAATAAEALRRIEAGGVDLVFQDIQMPGMSGFQVLERALAMEHPPLFVFVTAYDEYAVKAFEAEALDYLLKPVSEERLAACLDRVRQRLAARSEDAVAGRDTLERLLSTIEGASLAGSGAQGKRRIPVERDGRIRLTPMEDMLLFEVDGKRVLARIAGETGGDRHPLHGVNSLATLEERLDSGMFFRISRSAVVNLERIAEVVPYRDGKYIIVLDDSEHTEITVGRGRAGELKERLGLA